MIRENERLTRELNEVRAAPERAQAPAPGTGDEATRAAAERLIQEAKWHKALDVEDESRSGLGDDILLVANAVLAGDRAAERYRKALETIKQEYGRVCEEYELCSHPACESSVGAWMEADKALTEHEGAEAP